MPPGQLPAAARVRRAPPAHFRLSGRSCVFAPPLTAAVSPDWVGSAAAARRDRFAGELLEDVVPHAENRSGSKALSEVFARHDIKHELRVTGGGHTWINWRHYLNELAPKLFR